ncbi:Osmotin, thaumatin-like protein [Thozetella sp. PMI_491]|nr:Osmotin, thaumatin-like protein [Thozetella sp. PMI_491]
MASRRKPMRWTRQRTSWRHPPSTRQLVPLSLLGCAALASGQNNTSTNTTQTPIPIVINNNCPDVIWPGIGTQNGIGPGTGGFELGPGETSRLFVSYDWQGRIWGRTNCTFDDNKNGVGGSGAACLTGDCFGVLDCKVTGAVPVTLAEFNLWGGANGGQTFYDISLVDGYNLPLGIVYIPAKNTSWIPPNLTNAACIASAGYLADPARTGLTYTNSTYPMPYESQQTNANIGGWCPWDLQAFPPEKPGDGVYPYPDDNIQRPVFDPCLSACAYTHSDSDCCVGSYHDPNVCQPGLYSKSAKAMCPDAYSYAFDDQTSTFIVPDGGGWEIVFCPMGRSTNILATFRDQLGDLAANRGLTSEMLRAVTNITYIDTHPSAAVSSRPLGLLGLLAATLGVAMLIVC